MRGPSGGVAAGMRGGFPPWLRKRLPTGGRGAEVHRILRRYRVNTVCQSALCPNRAECFSRGTATFMILGAVCTRGCRFCAVEGGVPLPPEADEPLRVARAAAELDLDYVVVTSVTRDDLPDGGAGQFAATIGALRDVARCRVEVLVPDFAGSESALDTVLAARPDLLNHNLETVPRLYRTVRPGADYRRSLRLIERAGRLAPELPVKSGLMLGLGEEEGEVRMVLRDLLSAGCRALTLGQYLAPSPAHLPVVRFVEPEEFDAWREEALGMGFRAVAAGPFVRSSYRARFIFQQLAACGEG